VQWLAFWESWPVWGRAALAAALAIGVAALVGLLLARAILKGRLLALLREPGEAEGFRARHSARWLLRHSRLIERLSREQGERLIPLTGIDRLWIDSLRRGGSLRDCRRVLAWAPDAGLFQCFLASMERPACAAELVRWLEDGQDALPMRRLARSGVGESFDGRQALKVFRAKLPEIREMTGDPEWPSRYFALKLLLHDDDERSVQALWDGFADPHPLVRRTMAAELATGDRGRLESQLRAMILEDPSFEVRSVAHERLCREFGLDLSALGELDDYRTLHVLELLRREEKSDQDFALGYLDSDNRELRRAAADYLGRCGRLAQMCLEVDYSDRKRLNHNRELLAKACEVNVTSFLAAIHESRSSAPLLLCAELLKTHGARDWITPLARKVFGRFTADRELYLSAAQSVSERGDEQALGLLGRELERFRQDKELMSALLPLVPERAENLFLGQLLAYFEDPGFPAPDALRSTLRRLDGAAVLERTLRILRSGREAFPHAVRIQAVKLLAELELPYCLQIVLENLCVLPVEEARDLAQALSAFPKDRFARKVRALLEGPDARVRAALLSALPATRDESFLSSVREALRDADPDVRVAAVTAMIEYGDTRSLGRAAALLRDPVERVRSCVARAFGAFGSTAALDKLREVLVDGDEVTPVKSAAVLGLGRSSAKAAVELLVAKLDDPEGFQEQLAEALAANPHDGKLAHLVEAFKDGSPAQREGIARAFVLLKERGEGAMDALLREGIASLKPYIVEIFERTGYVERHIRRLAHRDPKVRACSAELLSLVGSTEAFKGLVLAARDPDQDVRVQVVKALERLETREGEETLRALENDPDRKVRKYTAWARARLRAKAL